VIKCPVCSEVYSYGRTICHTCGDKTFFFGNIFNERKHNYQWNCHTHSMANHSGKTYASTIELREPKKFETLRQELTHKNIYDWNCATNQSIPIFYFDLSESNKELLYE